MPSDGVVKLQTNVPEILALEYSDGRPCQSQFSGDQVMYTLADGWRLYVAPIVAQKIREAGITAGVPFEICRREVMRGTRRIVEIQVKNLDSVGAPGPIEAPTVNPVVTQAHGSAPNHNGSGTTNGNGGGHATPSAVAPGPDACNTATLEDAAAKLLERTGKRALEVVLAVEKHAQERGLSGFTFGAENVQRIWMTLFIQSARNGGR